tara:strand:+ start:59 stop:382 length:324 start_codon:yes stop_codon:yes gene_type:complete
MQTDVRQTIAVAATAQLQKYVKTTATDITKARIMAITAQASAANASVKIYDTVGAATASKLVAELKFGTADGEWTHFYVPGQGIYCGTGMYAVLSSCDFLVVTGTFT